MKEDSAYRETAHVQQEKQPVLTPTFLWAGRYQLTSVIRSWLIKDWKEHKTFLFGCILFICTAITTVIYYINNPLPDLNPDTVTYLNFVNHMFRYGSLVDKTRLPGYPSFIFLIYILAGRGNLLAVGIVQAVLFIAATLEIYILAWLLLRRTSAAFVIGLLVGTNVVILSYVKPIMSEGLALFQLTTVALAMFYFIRTLRPRAFWLVTICLILLFLTRPEWIYFPIVLYAYFLLIARNHGLTRRILRHVLLGLALCYGLLGSYVALNTYVNHYPGLTGVEPMNLLGKVLQYDMQDEAPPENKYISEMLGTTVQRYHTKSPYQLLHYEPALSQEKLITNGSFARDIILHHPIEFIGKSIPFFFSTITYYFDAGTSNSPTSTIISLSWLKVLNIALYACNNLFPFCILTWLFLLWQQRSRARTAMLTMGAIVLTVLYGTILTTLAGYTFYDCMRFHIVFYPLLILTIGISVLTTIQLSRKLVENIIHQFLCG